MGTRSTYRFISEETYDNKTVSTVIAAMYLQFDGYPKGSPKEIAEFLSKGKVVNGFSRVDELQFNGCGCLAAQVVDLMKDGVGGCYLINPKDRAHSSEDYTYDIIVNGSSITMVAYEVNGHRRKRSNQYVYRCDKIFSGTPEEFIKFTETYG